MNHQQRRFFFHLKLSSGQLYGLDLITGIVLIVTIEYKRFRKIYMYMKYKKHIGLIRNHYGKCTKIIYKNPYTCLSKFVRAYIYCEVHKILLDQCKLVAQIMFPNKSCTRLVKADVNRALRKTRIYILLLLIGGLVC